jgi:dTDP-D-glucose 4,6-dehydratase
MIDKTTLTPLIQNTDTVVLLAGLVGDSITKKYPEESTIINDQGVKNVIDLCTQSNAEKYILSFKDKTEVNPTILRFATAFGLSPRMRFDLTISEFTRELAIVNELLVYDAHTWRPYCHVKNFARLIQMVIEAPKDKVSFEVFNAGGNINNTTKQMLMDNILQKFPHGNVRYREHESDPRNYRVNFEKVKSVLGFEPKYTIQYGIDDFVDTIENRVFDHVYENRNIFGKYEISYRIPS